MKILNNFLIKAVNSVLLICFCVLFSEVAHSQNYYVNDASLSGDVFGAGVGSDANPGTLAAPFATIQHAINTVPSGSTVFVETGIYNEQVLVNKVVQITGAGGTKSEVNYTGTVGGKPTLFDVSVDGAGVSDMYFNVDLSKLRSAIIASAASLDNISVTNNTISAYGTPAGSYGDRNAVSINYAGSTNYRVATGGVNSIVFTGNIINGTSPSSFFRAGLATDESGVTATGNLLGTINHDILLRFSNNGNNLITGNTFNGGGMEVDDMNAGAGTLTISNNTFDGTMANIAAAGSPLLRLQNNYNGKTTIVSGNTFTAVDWGVNLSNYNNVTLDGNSFSPVANSTTYHLVTINTKSISSNSNLIVQVVNSATLTNNTFNNSGTLGGTALAFLNHDDAPGIFGTFTIGTSGNENSFNDNIANYVLLSNSTGASSGSSFPNYNSLIGAGPNAITTMACWSTDVDVKNNKFDVGSGLKLPTSMNLGEKSTLESRIFHHPDAGCLGLAIFILPVHNLDQNTYYGTIQAAVTAANANETIEVADGTFNEKVTISKSLSLIGTSESGCIIDGTSLGNGSGIKISSGVKNVVINNFTIQNHAGNSPNQYAGIYAEGGNDGIEVEHCTIKNNIGGSGFYANGPVDGVLLNDLEVFGHTNAFGVARGIVIWNGLKKNITITNSDIYNNNCCGIELQDGTATGVTMSNNNVHDNGDNGFGLTGLEGPGENLISGNTVSNNGRFGIEIKNPNGTGANSGAGKIVVSGNTVNRSNPIGGELRDIAGISVYRRGVLPGNVDVPTGVWVENNTVSGYQQPSTSDGFGIVVEGSNHTVTGNDVQSNDVGIQRQMGHTPYPGDGNQNNVSDNYFGRGNSPITCGVTVTNNTFSSNGVDTRDVGNVTGGMATNTTTGKSFCSIQAAINDAQTVNGHTILISSGTFAEDLVVNKELTIQGQGIGITIIHPATSNPNTGGGSWGGTNVIAVEANNVTIKNLTIDGDNPNLTSLENVGGANIDARNGIITNYNIGNFGNLEVAFTEVKNIFLRGIYQALGPTFNFHDNQVSNVQADPGSIAMFSFGSSGVYSNNTVTNSSDAIAANQSKGIHFLNNTVSNSASGIHTDNNGGSGGVADTIIGNTVMNSTAGGWGIWVFVPYHKVLVQGNTVSNVYVGMASAGSGGPNGETTFKENLVDGQSNPNSVVGMYGTTNMFGFGSSNNQTKFLNNYVKGFSYGFDLEAEAGYTLNFAANDNAIFDNSVSNVYLEGTGTQTQNFQCNWWGVPNGSGEVGAALNFTPWRTDGVDNQPGVIGFQPVSVCNLVCTPPVDLDLVGPKNVCPYLGTNEQITYTATSLDASGFTWQLPPNVNLIQGGNGYDYITVTFNAAFQGQPNKQIRITPFNDCGNGTRKIFYLLTQYSGTPDPIQASSNDVCAVIGTNTPIIYKVPKVIAATGYIWSAQGGTTTITHPNGPGVNDTIVEITFQSGFTSSYVMVKSYNDCGSIAGRSLYVERKNPSVPSLISGPSNVCEFIAPNGTDAGYSVDQEANVSSYTWTLPSGALNVVGQGTHAISFLYPNGYAGGSINVTATNGCGTSGPRSLMVAPLYPGAPSAIDVENTEECPNREFTYSLSSLPIQTTWVNWSIPSGGTITDGDGTSSITVSYISDAINGEVVVQTTNNCGISPTRTVKVKLPECPIGNKTTTPFVNGGNELNADMFSVQIYPNPTVSDFRMKVNTGDKSSKVVVRILDVQGREIERVQTFSGDFKSIGTKLQPGAYMIEVSQGKNRSIQKLIKL